MQLLSSIKLLLRRPLDGKLFLEMSLSSFTIIERACKLNQILEVVAYCSSDCETQAGDLSGYILQILYHH